MAIKRDPYNDSRGTLYGPALRDYYALTYAIKRLGPTWSWAPLIDMADEKLREALRYGLSDQIEEEVRDLAWESATKGWDWFTFEHHVIMGHHLAVQVHEDEDDGPVE